MSKKHEPDNFEQMSIFGIMNLLDNTENTLSSDDISLTIHLLHQIAGSMIVRSFCRTIMKRKNQSVISGSLLIHLGQLAMMQ